MNLNVFKNKDCSYKVVIMIHGAFCRLAKYTRNSLCPFFKHVIKLENVGHARLLWINVLLDQGWSFLLFLKFGKDSGETTCYCDRHTGWSYFWTIPYQFYSTNFELLYTHVTFSCIKHFTEMLSSQKCHVDVCDPYKASLKKYLFENE